ncbi:hypothetical protein G7Z17_g3470 [Cylindrodendrum hubeiense]|uniref:CorA-like transporter domain-containing protein n=1 Tax=Cylindrodendrum hubeiense TaxID=595255 RepID=A0A9P5HAS4_9HYPO|nr:hypothetical protein G7Z17_g3470 [Cylindrodendrum hubeiense]
MDWKAYPEHRRNAPPDAFDRSFYRNRLLDDAERLFTSGDSDVELFYVAKGPHAITTRSATDLASLDDALAPIMQTEGSGISSVFVFIKQQHSWDHLNISLELMQRLLASFDVSPIFLDYVHCFGHRLDAVGDDYVSHRSVQSPFPERNGRPTGNGWSIRQSGLYMQHDTRRNIDIWILLQPSKSFESQCRNIISSPNFQNALIHSALFYSVGRFWRDYIDDLQKELLPMEHKAFYSKVGVACTHDFSLVFKDYQLLQQLNQELERAEYILDASVDVAVHCGAGNVEADPDSVMEREPGQPRISAISRNKNSILSDYMAQTQGQRRVLARLLGSSQRALQTASSFRSICLGARLTSMLKFALILSYRNDEASQRIDGAIAKQTTALHDLLRVAARENEALAIIERRAQWDSRTVKVLTAVAALYLPAAFVATVFSSNLVQEDSSGFHLSRQFWLFPAATLLLTVLTLGPVVVWARFNNDVKSVAVNKAS